MRRHICLVLLSRCSVLTSVFRCLCKGRTLMRKGLSVKPVSKCPWRRLSDRAQTEVLSSVRHAHGQLAKLKGCSFRVLRIRKREFQCAMRTLRDSQCYSIRTLPPGVAPDTVHPCMEPPQD